MGIADPRFANPVQNNSFPGKIIKLLDSDKWWLVSELAQHLHTQSVTIYSAISRVQKRFDIETYTEHNGKATVKYYRKKRNGV